MRLFRFLEKRGKKGQFTIFVILGFVLLVTVLFLIFLVASIREANFQDQARNAIDDFLDASSIEYYVYTCMDLSVKEAANTLANQGGVFYHEEGGDFVKTVQGDNYVHVGFSFVSHTAEKFNVSYSVPKDFACPFVEKAPPEYPFSYTHINNYMQKYDLYNICKFSRPFKQSGVFGLNNLSRLCYEGSPNLESSNLVISPCFNSVSMFQNAAVEKELANQIVGKMGNCTDFEIFAEMGQHNVTMNGTPSARIVYGQDTFSVFLEYPFLVKLHNREPVLVKKEFEYKSNLRLTRLHNYVLNLISQETKNPLFNLTTDYANVQGYDSAHMKVSVLDFNNFLDCTGNCNYKFDRVLVVQDNLSLIGNRSLSFFSAIKNRIPALDYIHKTADGSFFDIIVFEGEKIRLEPWGVDPEEKSLTYEYIGWKETYDEYYDFGDPNCQLSSVDFGQLKACVKKFSDPLHSFSKWTDSQIFQDTNRIAEYTVDHDDTGPHELIIRITDESGLQDFQTVNILVIDKPNINVGVNPVYPGAPAGVLSVEDPFVLESSGSSPPLVGGFSISTFLWDILWNNNGAFVNVFSEEIPHTQLNLGVPLVPPAIDIRTIHLRELLDRNPSVNPDNHVVKLTLNLISNWYPGGVLSLSEQKDVAVAECLPYEASSGGYPPYPYNPANSNPFFANHVCCSGDFSNPDDFEIEDGSKLCFSGDWFGEKEKLKQKAEALKFSADLSIYFNTFNPPLDPVVSSNVLNGNPNDIYRLSFDRNCDGKRGNICAGKIDYELVKLIPCTYVSGSDREQCSGPPSPGIFDSSISVCDTYDPGDTFEKLFGSGTGICNKKPECSNLVSGTYGLGGPQFCRATCNGAGSCNKVRDQECECSQSCGAVCYAGKTSQWLGTTCSFGCDFSGGCNFLQSVSLPCSNGPLNYCKGTKSVSGVVYDWCFDEVSCMETGGSFLEGSPCHRGLVKVNSNPLDDLCMWGSASPPPSCSSSGSCSLSSKRRGDVICSGTLSCNMNTGWICQGGVPN